MILNEDERAVNIEILAGAERAQKAWKINKEGGKITGEGAHQEMLGPGGRTKPPRKYASPSPP